jgi:aminoglycoside 3-N-acetyltransferase
MRLHSAIRQLVDSTNTSTVFVHSDTLKVLGAIPRKKSMELWLAEHIRLLEETYAHASIIFPTFNYAFLRSGQYNPVNDISEVGALSEFARIHWASWRSEMPVFNYAGNKTSQSLNQQTKLPSAHAIVDPFDEHSIFHHLYTDDGLVLMYGAPFSSFTGIHHIEQLSGRPLYRYDKLFHGTIHSSAIQKKSITLNYHVRPTGLYLNYRWDELLKLAMHSGIVKELKQPRVQISAFNYRQLADFLIDHIKNDPLFLIDEQSRQDCGPILEKLGRRFLQSDFENTDEQS